MTHENLADYISAWLRPMTAEHRREVLSSVIDDFCPECGRENQPGLDGRKRRCGCTGSVRIVYTGERPPLPLSE